MTRRPDSFFTFDSPVGRLSIFFQSDPFCFTGIDLPRLKTDAREAPLVSGAESPVPDHPAAMDMLDQLNRCFKGLSVCPPWDLLRFDGLTALQVSVLKETARIPFGGLRSYSQLAAAVGHPRAARFVGSALSKNPFPLLIPCHRVIRSDGGLGGFGSGIDMKRKLLAAEGITAIPRLRYSI